MFEGFRIVELGTWVMMPSAATVLAEFGADVIKVEHPRGGDPFRASSLARQGDVNLAVEQVNRGKRSLGLDLSVAEGRELLYKLVASSDVFMTNFLPGARQKYRFDVEHIRAHNPDIVYVRGSSVGVRGAEADRPGFDFTVFWARSGFQSAVTKGSGLDRPVSPRPGFGDKTSAMNIAFGVAAALLRRERTGETAVVDVSLLGSGLWSGSSDVVYSRGLGRDFAARPLPRQPTSGVYRTSDGRFILFNIPDSGRVWPDLCRHVGREDLVDDVRFATAQARSEHADACVRELETAFAGATLSEWRRRLASLRVAWEVVQDPFEVAEDPQTVANGYIADVAYPGPETVKVVRSPVQFDERSPELGRAPGVGEHTQAIVRELGYGPEDVDRFRKSGAID